MKLGTLAILILVVLSSVTGCQRSPRESTPDYPVTVIQSQDTPTDQPLPTAVPSIETSLSPTFDWGDVTLLPDASPDPSLGTEEPKPEVLGVPDPLTEADLSLLSSSQGPYDISDVEASLGRVLLPVDLLALGDQDGFQVSSIPVSDYPDWRFLAFYIPRPEQGELGAVVRAPIDGTVMEGTMQMVNDVMVQTVSIDHPIGEDQVLRATLVFSGTVEPLFLTRQEVAVGDVLFRLTHETGQVETLGNTPIPGGATMTLHASIDSIIQQESGVETLKFVRGVSLTPSAFLKNEDGTLISPAN